MNTSACLVCLVCLFCLLWLCPLTSFAAFGRAGWDPTRLTVPVVVDGRQIPYPEFAVYVMPGQRVHVAFADRADGGTVRFRGETHATPAPVLAAPDEPGLTRVELLHASGERAVINLFTLVPARSVAESGRLNGYRIGRYPEKPLRGLAIYRPPGGFIEVTAENKDTRLSPNFRLGQFVSKQDQGFPKYVTLRENLLLKLETILAALNESGRPTPGLVIMSGFRTPWYNAAIGNVPYSRHVWGGAADIYVDDSPADGWMDDLNGDGKIDRNDAHWLATFADDLARRGTFGESIGGLGVYGSNAVHGPFIHVDVRGTRARW